MSSVDVIVPCYRYGHFLRECVDSVRAQSGLDVRVLIIDDASPDNTAEVASDLMREDSRVTFLQHTRNNGHIDAYNEGIEWASANYMLILSADDYLLPGALSRSSKLMDAYPEVGFSFGRATTLDNRGLLTPHIGLGKPEWHILTGQEFIRLSGSRNIVPTPTAVVRTVLQKQVGGYRPELPHCGDMEMWLRLAAHASVGIVQSTQAVYRRHSDNMSQSYRTQGSLPDLQQRQAALERFFQTSSFSRPDAERLHRELFWSLGCDAVGLASAAFNDGEMEVSEQLCAFALAVCPQVERSLSWRKLACKRRLGRGAWHALQPSVAGMRRLGSSLRRIVSLLHNDGA